MSKKPTYEELEQRIRELEQKVNSKTMLTEQKKSESYLSRLATVIMDSNDTITVQDLKGNITAWNKGAEKMYGYKEAEALKMNIQNIIPGDKKKEALNFVQKLQEEEEVESFNTMRIAKDGRVLNVWLIVTKLADDKGKIVAIATTERDITKYRQMEEQLLLTQKMESIGTLAGGIAHDFNNLLGVILGNVSYALNKLKDDCELTEALQDVQESVRRGTNLTQQLITFAKGGAPIKKVIDLHSLIKGTAKLILSGSISACRFNLSKEVLTIEVDEGQLNQALSNLFINALQAMPEGGIVQIDTKKIFVDESRPFPLVAGTYVCIIIKDQGTGIPENHLSKIFDPFFTTKQKGSGLGLSTTFSIIKRHEGHIWVESKLGEGSAFTIYLPITEKILNQPENKDEIDHKGRGRILIMDDQDHMLKMAGRMIGEMGYNATFAKDGAQTIDSYREAFESEEPFDLAILDLTVPGGMGGAKTIPELLKINPNAKVVVSSGYSNDPVMTDYKSYGFCGILEKPYSSDQMAELLNEILGEK